MIGAATVLQEVCVWSFFVMKQVLGMEGNMIYILPLWQFTDNWRCDMAFIEPMHH